MIEKYAPASHVRFVPLLLLKGIRSAFCVAGWVWMRLFGCKVPFSSMIVGLPTLWFLHGRLSLGERVTLLSMRSAHPFGQEFPRCVLSSAPGAVIDIGDDTFIAGSAFFAQQKITIGKRVMIAAGCRIADTHFHDTDSVPRRYAPYDKADPVVLEDDVWLAAEVSVGPGVHIGKGSVIGTKSVVTSDIPPMVLAAGIPARVIRPLKTNEHSDAAHE